MQTMKNTVAIVDYGMGNLRSVWQAVQAAAADSSVQVQVTHDPAVVHAASRVVLPGQGAMRAILLYLLEILLLVMVGLDIKLVLNIH